MTDTKNRTSPNTFARYIENMRTRATASSEFLLTKDAHPLAGDFPCGPCGGEGVLVKESRFRPLRGGDFFKSSGGVQVRSTEMIFCPCCHGDGIDQAAIDNSVLNQTKLEVA